MILIKDYMDNHVYRHELNVLTRDTFGFDFERWYSSGYCSKDYIPYAYEENGKIIANAAVYHMYFDVEGEKKHFIQITTVMTDKAYRNQGLGRRLIEEILNEYMDKVQEIYLFGNLKAVGFYEKLGFKRINETKYYLSNKVNSSDFSFIKSCDKGKYEDYVKKAAVNSGFSHLNKYGLHMFNTIGMEDVYYCEELDCFVVYEIEEDTCYLLSVICPRKIKLFEVIGAIKEEYSKLELGFTPVKEELKYFQSENYDGSDDYRLFYLGEGIKVIEENKLYFPICSHA